MTTPQLRVELATTGGPFTESPTWATLPAVDVLAFSMVEGRTSPTAQTTAPSSATVTFDNSRRLYDPTHAAGTYYTSLKPGRQIRVTAVEADTTETVLFRGVVTPEGWQQVDYRHPATSRAVVQCVDWLGALASWPDDLPPFEAYLRRLAVDHGLWGGADPGVLHWPFDDSQGWGGRQSFNDPVDNSDVESPHGVRGYYARADATDLTAAGVYSDVALRGSLSGSLDSKLGIGYVETSGMTVGALAAANYHNSYGFAVRLRSLPAADKAPMVVTDYGHGFYLDRDGELFVTFNGGDDYVTAGPANELELGRTYFVCVTWDGTTLALYLDGVLVGSDGAYPLYVGSNPANLILGGKLTANTINPIANYCDLFAIATPLTESEISALFRLWVGFEGVLTGVAAGTLLDSLGVPNGCVGGRVGLGDMGPGAGPMSILQPIERTELGRLYVDHRSEQVDLITFEAFAIGTRHTVSQATLSDQAADTTAIRYARPVLVNLPPTNSVTASNSAAGFTLTDETSVSAYGVQSLSVGLASGPASDPLSVAQHLLDLNPDPSVAVSSVTVEPSTAAAFGAVLDVELFDLVTLKRHPHSVGSVVETSMLVEGRSVAVGDGVGRWEVALFLRERDVYEWWLWGSGQFHAGAGLYDGDDNGKRLGP